MKLLLDTHVLVWWWNDPARLSKAAHAAIGKESNQVLISAGSCYEIDYKRDKSDELNRLPRSLEDAVLTEGFEWLAITPRHATEAACLPRHHRDPWDRLLVGQARIERAVLVTADSWISAYGVQTLW